MFEFHPIGAAEARHPTPLSRIKFQSRRRISQPFMWQIPEIGWLEEADIRLRGGYKVVQVVTLLAPQNAGKFITINLQNLVSN